ncbi:hypothetical protein CWO84_17335 [Methylomonas sp. Kb3]|uniref:hypothetical protein n=1 Tax=Methylomonas sp. Kb3 TaxID=1611544 RepID=UPI000C31ED85|nr:hypothetical protein [Methylomonas sp. Kb3]PKD38819.1 hypothetical protein CWO84_17335 [Methylomonas sp. Kb3]
MKPDEVTGLTRPLTAVYPKPGEWHTPVFRNVRLVKIAAGLGVGLTLTTAAQAGPSPVISFGQYRSHQVNVDADGQNIIGDKGNEPTLALNPLNPANIVVGWRRFDSPPTAVKHGGYAYSFDGGVSWGTGMLPALPLQTRTDPVLEVDGQGNFYYQSLAISDSTSVFKSSDGGVTWSEPVYQFKGDKNWLAIDKTGGPSDGHIYSTWRRPADTNPDPHYVPKYFSRSTDGGLSYQEPDAALPVANFGFGRLAIGPEGEVYLFGVDETILSVSALGIVRSGHYFLKSVDAKDPNTSPSFSAQKVDMGGHSMMFLSPSLQLPNPLGGDGDVQIAADQSAGPLRGNIYLLAHVSPYTWQTGGDPQDIHFVRSSDGGATWSAPVRVNDEPPAANAYQWFPMLGVAANSRLDAVWYDTRNGSGSAPYRYSQLYYAYSWDGGVTWSKNQAVTPVFNTHLPYNIVNGEERQGDKMGDYTQIVSDANGAHIAYTATYHGEQDVYYLNVFPDCNNNGKSDVLDIQNRVSGDTNFNHLPDSCESISVRGDLDGDRDVDQLDLNLVIAARNQPATGVDDPRDLDKNGVINVLDVRKLTLLCTRSRCAI